MSFTDPQGTATAGLPYGPASFGPPRSYGALARSHSRAPETTDLLAFWRQVPAPSPSHPTESTVEPQGPEASVVHHSWREETDAPAYDADSEPEIDPAVATASARRRDLLARQFARKHMSPEHLARLEILEERLRALAPLVSEEAVARLELAQEQVASADELLERVRRELSAIE